MAWILNFNIPPTRQVDYYGLRTSELSHDQRAFIGLWEFNWEFALHPTAASPSPVAAMTATGALQTRP